MASWRLSSGVSTAAVVIITSAWTTDPYPSASAHLAPITALAFSPNAGRVVTADDAVRLWDVRTGRLDLTLARRFGRVSSLAFSATGAELAVGTFDGSLTIWDVAGDQEKTTVPTGSASQVKSIAFSPDGLMLATTGADGLRVWDAKTAKVLHHLPSTRGVLAVAFSSDSRLLATAGGEGVKIWNPQTGALIRDMGVPVGDLPLTVAFSPDGRWLAAGGTGRIARVWNLHAAEAFELPTEGEDFIRAIAFRREPGVVAVADRRAARVWDVRGGRMVAGPASEKPYVVVALSPDGQLWAGGDDTGVPKLVAVGELE